METKSHIPTEDFSKTLCYENCEEEEITKCTVPAWNKSLIRNIVLVVLKLLRKIAENEINVENGQTVQSHFSKYNFFVQLAKVMTTFRRKSGVIVAV